MKDWEKIGRQLNKVSSSFCLAKWLQVTIDLHNGTTHSCHHPKRHKIPLEELEEASSALHNTYYKKQQRKKMLESVRPDECQYCWNIEDSDKENVSDRLIKSSDDWAYPLLGEIAGKNWDEDISPTYLEVMFSNTCNLSCSYCMASVSSSIDDEIKKFGHYSIPQAVHRLGDYADMEPPSKREREKYLEAFWNWFPEIYDGLKVFRVTGGEPLLDTNVFQLLDYLENHENKELTFAINTNFSLPLSITKKFFESTSLIKNKIKALEVYISLEQSGDKASYIRSGLNMTLFNKNIEAFRKKNSNSSIIVMCTFNILCMDNFVEYLKYILELKTQFKNITLDISYLRDPSYLSPRIATETQVLDLEESLAFMEENKSESVDNGFTDYEIQKLKRIYSFIKWPLEQEDVEKRLASFYHFINEFDKRKKRDFSQSFKNLSGLYTLAKKCAYKQYLSMSES